MTKTIKQLSKEIAEHLGINPLPIKFEDLGDVDMPDKEKNRFERKNSSH